jgi:hypothetical protein
MFPDWILFLPIFFPLVGAIIFALIARRLPHAHLGLAILWLGLELVAILVNIAPGSHQLALAGWSAASFSIAWQIDGVNLLLLLVMFVPLLAIWLIAPPQRPFDLWLMPALTGAILLLTAANVVTLYLAWAVFDLAIFLWRIVRDIERATIVRGLVIGQLTGLIYLAGAILLAAHQTAPGAFLIAVALWARLGIFPFHYLLPTRGADAADVWFARGVPMLAASNLWLHWSVYQVDIPSTLVGTLATVAIIVAAIWVWREDTPIGLARVGTEQAIAFVPLAIVFGGDAGVALGLWLALAAVMALALFEIAFRWRADNLNRWSRLIWFAGLLTLAAPPLTPAFLGRLGIYIALWESNNGVPAILMGLASLITLVPFWGVAFSLKGNEQRDPTRFEYVGLTLILVACAALAFLPMVIAHALAPNVGNSAERAIDLVIHTDDVAGVGLAIALLALTLIGSFSAQARAHDFYRRFGASLRNLARLLDLDWLERFGVAVGYRLGTAARGILSIAEENPTVWLLFAALWVAIFVIILR